MAHVENLRVDSKSKLLDIARIVTNEGLEIFAIPLDTVPGLTNNVYFINDAEWPTLVDAGTQGSHEALEDAFRRLNDEYGVTCGLADLRLLFITHGHGDHFGNAHAFREMGVPIAIHSLGAHTLRSLEQRLPIYRRELGLSARRAGYSEDLIQSIVRAPFFEFPSLEADIKLEDGDQIGAGWTVTHVPGHAPDQLVLRVDDVLFTADHLLARITPAQGPASRQAGIGLDNYLRSLQKIRPFSEGLLGLGGHEEPIADIPARIDETIAHHEQRLRQIRDFCGETARSGADICRHLFGEFESFTLVLALSETLAHVEYLLLLGTLDVTNSDEPGDVFDDVLYYTARDERAER